MKRYHRLILLIITITIFAAGGMFYMLKADSVQIDNFISGRRLPRIRPDYAEIVIPPNIAPLNHVIEESGNQYFVKIYSTFGKGINITSKSPKIMIPSKAWRKLLNENLGNKLIYETYVKSANNRWIRYNTYSNTIAKEKIDGYVAYRLMNHFYHTVKNLHIQQQNLENFDKKVILSAKAFGHGCANCHTFLNNSPDNMILHIRGSYGSSMVMIDGENVKSIDSRTPFGSLAMAYSAWHPSGKLIAFSVNKVRQFFHSTGAEVRDSIDLDSSIGIYSVVNNEILTPPQLSADDKMESLPTWSPDGKYLYFSTSKHLWTDRDKMVPERYKEIKYDLVRISYDIENDIWGELETVISSMEIDHSIAELRFSPDGRFLVFSMFGYSCLPNYQRDADLYIMDMETNKYRKMECNSDMSESWHSWSSNSRWMAFSSKRLEGQFNRIFFSYIDENGKAYKPFILPQKDPEFYDHFTKIYQLPELITGPVKPKMRDIVAAIKSPQKIANVEPVTAATPSMSSRRREHSDRE